MFSHVIENEIKKTKCVLVLWSNHSKQSRYVVDEAIRGAEKKVLLQAKIDKMDSPPVGFGAFHLFNLVGWSATKESSDMERIIKGITQLTGKSPIAPSEPSSKHHQQEKPRIALSRPQVMVWGLVGIVVLGLLTYLFIWQEKQPPQVGEIQLDSVKITQIDSGNLVVPAQK